MLIYPYSGSSKTNLQHSKCSFCPCTYHCLGSPNTEISAEVVKKKSMCLFYAKSYMYFYCCFGSFKFVFKLAVYYVYLFTAVVILFFVYLVDIKLWSLIFCVNTCIMYKSTTPYNVMVSMYLMAHLLNKTGT